MRLRKIIRISLVGVLCLLVSQPVYGQSSSTNYKVEETYFGSGGNVDQSSPSYKAQTGTGSLGVGSSSSANYDAEAGFYTPNEIFLEFVVSNATVDLGTLATSTSTSGAAQGDACNCSFYVRSYLSSGYVVITVSQPPTSENGAVLTAKSTLGVPSISTSVEEFGINLRANTSPAVGADPLNFPNGTFADGRVASGYDVVNQFKYGVGDTIAQSPATVGNQGTGKTDYTISYIAKRKNTTSAGLYSLNHVLVVVPTF